MLDLYTHEIPCPEDRAIRKFLWYSAFHDAQILALQNDDGRDRFVTLRIFGGGYSVRRGEYLLRFHGVRHIEYASEPGSSDRLYATIFLNSAALHQEQAECSRPLYHLRILTWGGYMDLIFERFTIRLEGGRVDYRPQELDDAVIAASRDRRYRSAHAEAANRLASSHPYDMDEASYIALGLRDEDLDEYHAFGLYITARDKGPEAVAAHAREVLEQALARFSAPAYAAHLLGLHGTAEDLPRLTALLLAQPTWSNLNRRILLDAMARIHARTHP